MAVALQKDTEDMVLDNDHVEENTRGGCAVVAEDDSKGQGGEEGGHSDDNVRKDRPIEDRNHEGVQGRAFVDVAEDAWDVGPWTVEGDHDEVEHRLGAFLRILLGAEAVQNERPGEHRVLVEACPKALHYPPLLALPL